MALPITTKIQRTILSQKRKIKNKIRPIYLHYAYKLPTEINQYLPICHGLKKRFYYLVNYNY